MIEVGTHVKIRLPKKQGARKQGDMILFKRGMVIGIYKRFYLIEMNYGYKECYFKYEVFEDEEWEKKGEEK